MTQTFTAADMAQAFEAGLALGQRSAQPETSGETAEQRRERLDAYLDDAARRVRGERPALRLLTEDQVRDVLNDDGPVPVGLDPASIDAARRIAKRLNGITR